MRSVARAAALAGALLLLAAAPAEGTAVEIYKAANRPAAELLPLAEAAMAGEGSAALDAGTNSVVLMGPPAAVERTLALLRQQDQKRRTVLLRYESKRADELAAEQIRVDWSTGGESLRVGNVIFPTDRSGVRATGRVIQSNREDSLAGTLRLLDGEVGHIATGETVPVRDRGLYTSSLAFVTAERGFTARPRILAEDRVQVEITATDDRLVRSGEGRSGAGIGRVFVSPDEAVLPGGIDDRAWVEARPIDDAVDEAGRVRFTGATTTVIVKPGETVALGGISRSSSGHREGSRVLTASEAARSERVLLLTVDIDE